MKNWNEIKMTDYTKTRLESGLGPQGKCVLTEAKAEDVLVVYQPLWPQIQRPDGTFFSRGQDLKNQFYLQKADSLPDGGLSIPAGLPIAVIAFSFTNLNLLKARLQRTFDALEIWVLDQTRKEVCSVLKPA